MRWFNLKQNKCPDCNKRFTSFSKEMIICKCGFSISTKKFNKIVQDMINKEREPREPKENSQEYNQNYLNNL